MGVDSVLRQVRLAWAFFKRDALIAISYRTSFVVQLLGNFVILGVFYYIGQTVGGEKLPALEKYGGSFLAFLLVGIALGDCVGVSLTSFAQQIREGQLTGTLEVTLMSPVRLPVILLYSSLWNYFFSAVRFALYLVLGTVFYSVGLAQANLPAALAVFLLTVMCFMGVGILWASLIMVVKRGEAIINVVGMVVILMSGVLFPTDVLPVWLRQLSAFVPLTPALDGMRQALLRGQGVAELAPVLLQLAAFAIVLLAAGFTVFHYSVKTARRLGTLTEY